MRNDLGFARTAASSILNWRTKDYSELKKWYAYMLSGKWDYVVLVNKRCYILALVLEMLTGEEMSDVESTKFLTDSSIIQYSKDICEFYRENNKFPKILLCDDILIHGYDMNYVIESLEKRVEQELHLEALKIREELSTAINIHVYVENNGPLTLISAYNPSLHPMKTAVPRDWHELSASISFAIENSGIANTSYVDNVFVSSKLISIEKLKAFYNSTYNRQNEKVHLKLKADSDSRCKYALSLRLLEVDEYYNIIPFVFLPVLDEELSNTLISKVKKALAVNHIDFDSESISNVEFIEFILSEALLYEFCQNCGISDIYIQHAFEAARKLSRQFAAPSLSGKQLIDLLRAIITDPPFKNEHEVEALLDDVFINASTSPILFTYSSNTTSIDETALKHMIENYFYIKGSRAEHDVCIQTKLYRLFESKMPDRNVASVSQTLTTLCENRSKSDVKTLLAYFLQMMDLDLISVSGASTNYSETRFTQFAKPGKESLRILPQRMSEYMKFISLAYDCCESGYRDFSSEIKHFFKSPHGEQLTKLAQEAGDEIDACRVMNFIENLEKVEQTPQDWDIDYAFAYGFYGNKYISEAYDYAKHRSTYYGLYQKYLLS